MKNKIFILVFVLLTVSCSEKRKDNSFDTQKVAPSIIDNQDYNVTSKTSTNKDIACDDKETKWDYRVEDSNYHCYQLDTEVCDTRNKNCNIKNVYSHMLTDAHFIAPIRSNDNDPIVNCKERLLFGVISYNPIRTIVNESNYSITNITKKGHLLYPGKVNRVILQQGNKIIVRTTGQGSGTTEKIKYFNSYMGPAVFRLVDFQFINSFNKKYKNIYGTVKNINTFNLKDLISTTTFCKDRGLAYNPTSSAATWVIKRPYINIDDSGSTYLWINQKTFWGYIDLNSQIVVGFKGHINFLKPHKYWLRKDVLGDAFRSRIKKLNGTTKDVIERKFVIESTFTLKKGFSIKPYIDECKIMSNYKFKVFIEYVPEMMAVYSSIGGYSMGCNSISEHFIMPDNGKNISEKKLLNSLSLDTDENLKIIYRALKK